MSEHELWNELGNLYFMSGAYNQAAHAYQRSIQADTDFGRPYSNLALTYVQQGNYDEAIELYRRSVELLADNKEKAISLNRLGNVYRHLKDYSRAVVAFQEADELDPHSTDEFPPAAPPRAQASEAPSSVLDEPVTDIVYVPAADLVYEQASLAVEVPVAEASDLAIAAAPEDSLAETPEEPAVETVQEPVAEPAPEAVAPMPDEPLVADIDEVVAEISIEPAAVAAEPDDEIPAEWLSEYSGESTTVASEEPVGASSGEWPGEIYDVPEPQDPEEPHEPGIDERMTKRLGFLVGEALDQAAMTIAEQPARDSKEPEAEPEFEWWDVEDERIDSATQSHAAAPGLISDASTSWTPADLSQFHQDLSQMPDTGSLTTWGEPDFDDDFERWSPLEQYPDVDTPDPDSDNISTWLPIPEESPLDMDELRVPPFVDELEEEAESPSDWESLVGYHAVDAGNFTPILPSSLHSTPAEPPARSEAAASEQKAWETRHVDVDVQERPAQEPSNRLEMQPAARPAPPELVLAPVVTQTPAPAETDRDEDEMREIEMGIEKFRRVVQLNPRNAHAWDALGTLFKSAGQYKDAILSYQQAISNDSSKSLYYHHLGLVYACEGRDEDAISAFQRVIEIDPEYSLAHATLGGYYRKMGLEELAQKHIGKAMKNIFDSENEYNRACLEAICGNADQAIKLLDVALKNKQTYVDWILRDPDLDFIRQDPRFKQLISRYTR